MKQYGTRNVRMELMALALCSLALGGSMAADQRAPSLDITDLKLTPDPG